MFCSVVAAEALHANTSDVVVLMIIEQSSHYWLFEGCSQIITNLGVKLKALGSHPSLLVVCLYVVDVNKSA